MNNFTEVFTRRSKCLAVNMKTAVFLVILNIFECRVEKLPPNVCKNFADYLTMEEGNCWHNPDVYLSPPEIVKRHGYPIERYETTTEDGYLLDMYRMPQKNNRKGVVLLEPPAFCTFSGWIDKGRNGSLGFMLHDSGYEVWLGNLRGTYYSRKHVTLQPSDYEFWNYSFHEMGKYDMPAQVDLVSKISGSQPGGISIVSFSLGSTVSVIYACLKPQHSGKWINLFALMAPSTILNNIIEVDKYISKSVGNLEKFADDYQVGELLAKNEVMWNFLSVCRGPYMIVCLITDLFTMGNVAEELPPEWIPIKFSQNPGGVSFKIFLHYMQIINSRKFQFYDYGKQRNLMYYGTEIPPKYPTGDVQSPILLISADHDVLSTPKDADLFYNELPARAKIYGKMFIKHFSHSAFYYGTTTAERVYKPILNLLDQIYISRM